MKDWKKVNGSQPSKPTEFDTTSSKDTIYQRRNVGTIQVDNMDGTKTTLWEYEERELTPDEYMRIYSEMAEAKLKSAADSIAVLEDVICELDSAN